MALADALPKEGDVYTKGDRSLIVDYVTDDWCCYRVIDGNGGLLKSARCHRQDFVRLAKEEGAVKGIE